MPLPDNPFTITGGCSCGAVRYRVAVPEKAARPIHPVSGHLCLPPETSSSGSQLPAEMQPPRLPHVMTCHCNSCRLAVGTSPAHYLACPANIVTVSVLPMDAAERPLQAIVGRLVEPPTQSSTSGLPASSGSSATAAPSTDADGNLSVETIDAARPPYLPALDVLRPDQPAAVNTWLRFFHSKMCSDLLSRAFCARCGTTLSFHYRVMPEFLGGPEITRMPDGWEDIIDFSLGTVDRFIAEQDWMAPEREFNFEIALPWVQGVHFHGTRTVKHPTFLLCEDVDERGTVKSWKGGVLQEKKDTAKEGAEVEAS